MILHYLKEATWKVTLYKGNGHLKIILYCRSMFIKLVHTGTYRLVQSVIYIVQTDLLHILIQTRTRTN